MKTLNKSLLGKILKNFLDLSIIQLYNISMKLSEMPDWVLKYKKKGYTVRLNSKSCYCLYRVWSEYVPGSHPKTHSEYVGVIKEKEGLITPKERTKTKLKEESIGHYNLEYGYSEMLYRNFRRALQRSLFNVSGRKAEIEIRLAIIRSIYGNDSEEMLSLSWWTARNKAEALETSASLTEKRKKTLDSRLDEIVRSRIVDDGDRFLLKEWLLLAVARDDEESPSPLYSSKAVEIAERWRIEL